jgi:hypothetical protein
VSARSELESLAKLELLYEAAIRACAPPNLSFDFERTLAGLARKRDVAFVLGLLSDGENEAALCLELARDKLAASPGADVGHILDEGWYYLRTSIELGWQLEAGPAPVRAMLAYLETVLRERTEQLGRRPRAASFSDEAPEERAALLRRLQREPTLS